MLYKSMISIFYNVSTNINISKSHYPDTLGSFFVYAFFLGINTRTFISCAYIYI